MRCVGARTEQSLLFSGEKDETNGPARQYFGGFDGPKRIDDKGGIAAVVEGPGPEIPGIEMGADNHELVGLFCATEFGNDVGGFYGSADLVGDGKIDPDQILVREQARHPFAVFPRHNDHGYFVDLAGTRVGVAIQDVMLAGGHESDGFRLCFNRTVYHGRRICVFGKQISPGLQDRGVYEKNLARNITCLLEIGVASLAHIDYRDVLHRSQCWRPGHRNRAHMERGEHGCSAHSGGTEFIGGGCGHLRGGFGPGVWNFETLRMHAVGACRGEGLHTPLHRVLHGESTGDAASDLVGYAAEVGCTRSKRWMYLTRSMVARVS